MIASEEESSGFESCFAIAWYMTSGRSWNLSVHFCSNCDSKVMILFNFGSYSYYMLNIGTRMFQTLDFSKSQNIYTDFIDWESLFWTSKILICSKTWNCLYYRSVLRKFQVWGISEIELLYSGSSTCSPLPATMTTCSTIHCWDSSQCDYSLTVVLATATVKGERQRGRCKGLGSRWKNFEK